MLALYVSVCIVFILCSTISLRWCAHVLRKDENDWMDYDVEGIVSRGRPKKTWSDVVEKIARSDNCARKMILIIGNGKWTS